MRQLTWMRTTSIWTVTIAVSALAFAGAQTFISKGENQITMNGHPSHGCPPNHAMAGTNFGGDGNTFRCEYVGTITQHKIGRYQREGMLGCEQGWFMTALNVVNNLARCSTTGRPMAADTTIVDGDSNSAEIVDCKGSNARNAGVMVGFRKDTSLILCSAVER